MSSLAFTKDHLETIVDGGSDLAFLNAKRVTFERNGLRHPGVLSWITEGTIYDPSILPMLILISNDKKGSGPDVSMLYPLPTTGRSRGFGDYPFTITLDDQEV